jgi:hypothetical protein
MILLALTVPMLWSPLLFRCFSETILEVDASLVGRMLGTTQAGNMVRFADGSGELVIFPACSSIANLLGHHESGGETPLDLARSDLVLPGGCVGGRDERHADQPDGFERVALPRRRSPVFRMLRRLGFGRSAFVAGVAFISRLRR